MSSGPSPGNTTAVSTTTTGQQPTPAPTVDPSSPYAPQPQPGSFLSGGLSPPLIVGFISVGAFAVAIIFICAWSRFMGRSSVFPNSLVRRFHRFVPASFRRRSSRGRRRQEEEEEERGRRWRRRSRGGMTSVEIAKTKPVMFDAWIERPPRRRRRRGRSVDILKWGAESVVSNRNVISQFFFMFC